MTRTVRNTQRLSFCRVADRNLQLLNFIHKRWLRWLLNRRNSVSTQNIWRHKGVNFIRNQLLTINISNNSHCESLIFTTVSTNKRLRVRWHQEFWGIETQYFYFNKTIVCVFNIEVILNTQSTCNVIDNYFLNLQFDFFSYLNKLYNA